MKLIATGDITKHAPANTKDALILGINTDYIYGIGSDIQLTKDLVPIVLANPLIKNLTPLGDDLSNLTYKQVKQLRLGDKIQSHNIVTLEEALIMFSLTSKPFILNLIDQGNRNKEFVEIVVDIILKYPAVNLYVKSNNKEIALYFNAFKTKAKSGIVISSNDPLIKDLKFDFFSFYEENLNEEVVKAELKKSRTVMIEDINTPEKLQELGEKLDYSVFLVFIITQNIIALYNALTLYEKSLLKINEKS
ncbi:MAG: glycerophosphodiester phosphodiesterase family protein [Bacilli bacterium]